uniref:MFS domain-containing protein n=1 Tax=Strongyloides papillosus TaxID=174720 RepID=A0A0N5CHD9_STREA
MISRFFFCYNEPTLTIALEPFNMLHAQGLLLDHLSITNTLLLVGNILLTTSLFLFGLAHLIPFQRTTITVGVASIIHVPTLAACYIPCFKQSINIITNEYGCSNDMNISGILPGIFTCIFSLGGFADPTIGAIFVQYYQYTTTSTIIGYAHVVFVVIFVIFYSNFKKKPRKSTENTPPMSSA